jgi:NAD-dependent dihydropyrimidine dehydrogenase PreA subunit
MRSTSEFIRVEVDPGRCAGLAECGGCVRVCPVAIFGKAGDRPSVVEANQDECILCELCLKACAPGAIAIRKLYES